MAFFEWINHADIAFFLWLNGQHKPFLDGFYSLFTSKELWFPFYLVLLLLFIKKYRRQAFWVILLLVIAIVLADQFSNLFKHGIERLRPSHEPALAGKVHNTFVGRGGQFGFVSGHAANAFALTVFLGKLVRRRAVWLLMVAWALLTVYSRIYVGVHYPLDVICGGTMGTLIGWGMYRLLILLDTRFFRKEISKNNHWTSKQYMVIVWALLMITVTATVVSYLLLKYHLIS